MNPYYLTHPTLSKESSNRSSLFERAGAAAALIAIANGGCRQEVDVPQGPADISRNPGILVGSYSDGLEIEPGNCTAVFGKASNAKDGCPTNETELRRTMNLHPDQGREDDVPSGERTWLVGAVKIASEGRERHSGVWMGDSTVKAGTGTGAYYLCDKLGNDLNCYGRVRLAGADQLQMRVRGAASRAMGPWKSYQRGKR